MSNDQVLNELRQAAERKEQLAQAYTRKAEHFREEAKEFRTVARQIERRLSQASEEGKG